MFGLQWVPQLRTTPTLPEPIPSRHVTQALFQTAAAWARQRGLRRLLGPMNPSSNYECGLLVDGFDRSPVLMMTYNPTYYQDLITAEGFTAVKDLLAFHIDFANCPIDRLQRVAARFVRREPAVQIRPIRRRTLAQDLPRIKEIYNEAWRQNWGFTPMTDAEVDYLAGRLKPLLTEGLTWIAETASEPVGILLALPDYNEAIKPLRGRLLTPRLYHLLSYMLGWKKPAMLRVVALGVKNRFRGRGVETVMLAEAFKTALRIGFRGAEASWILEDNLPVRRVIEIFGGKPYKTYRLYQRSL